MNLGATKNVFDEKGNLISDEQKEIIKKWFIGFLKYVNSPNEW